MKWGAFVEVYLTTRITRTPVLVAVTLAQYKGWKKCQLIAKPAVLTFWEWGPGEELLFGAAKHVPQTPINYNL